VPAADHATGSVSQAVAPPPVVAVNRLSSNRLAANKLASNKLAANRLAANRLSSNRLAANGLGTGDLLSTPDGRNVLSYVIGCALPAGETLVAPQSGAPACSVDTDCPNDSGGLLPFPVCSQGQCVYEFPGNVGLAPQWADEPLDRSGKRWVSACLLARCNAHDVAVEISLRGENPALVLAAGEAQGFTVEEGAFYGDVFTVEGQPIVWFACRGAGKTSGEFGSLVERDCASPDPANPAVTQCGFTYSGNCGDFRAFLPGAPREHACEEFERGDRRHDRRGNHGDILVSGQIVPSAGSGVPAAGNNGSFYEDCREGPGKATHDEIKEVITTFVSSAPVGP
jgi:hypothetical protein